MPTGYTAPVLDGTHDFQHFLWNASRAIGYMFHLREESGFGIAYRSDRRTYDTGNDSMVSYRQGEIDRARANLDKYASLEAFVEFRKQRYEEQLRHYEEDMVRFKAESKRLNDMRKKVQAWDPPTPEHAGLKDFMLQQLRVSEPYKPSRPEKPDPKRMAGDHAAAIDRWMEDIRRNEDGLEKEKTRYDCCDTWIDQLHASVPIPPEWDKRGNK